MRQASLEKLDLASTGDSGVLNRVCRALLISRTPKRPAPGTPWVRKVAAAAQASAAAGEALVLGAERTPFDVALAVLRREKGAALVVLEAAPDAAWRGEYAQLLPEQHLLVWPAAPEGKKKQVKSRPQRAELPRRDRLLGELAGCAWAIHLRKGGHMAAVAAALAAKGGSVDFRFSILDFRLEQRTTAPLLLPAAPPLRQGWDFLTHFTREPEGAWVDESCAAYAQWLACGPLDSRRDACAALRRILALRRVLGSGRLMPAREPMVSFTARAPWELDGLVRWRRGLGHWTFRPYGLAVKREILAALGAQAVRYASAAQLQEFSREERRFAQKHAPPRTDWSAEAEWRLGGDFSFDTVPKEALCVLVPTRVEAQAMAAEAGLECVAICG